MTKEVYMIGGPNGAGKTTTTKHLLAREDLQLHEFVNADIIAAGLSPSNPDSMVIQAARLMIQRLEKLVEEEQNFIFETTCAGRNYIRTLEACKAKGYVTHLIFLWLPEVEMAIDRVRRRVKQGGHSIPDETIRRRYQAGIKNLLTFYINLCDNVVIYDNTDAHLVPVQEKIADKTNGRKLTIYNQEKWQAMQRYV